jgi:DeoR/GlpR family transcriptional regulator of sugar metabolism
MVAVAREVVALVDHSKWGRVALATSCPFARIDHIITDESITTEFRQTATEKGILLHFA